MKTYLLYLILVLLPVNIFAQTIAPQDEKLIDNYLREKLTSAKFVVGPVAVSKVFNGNFYIVDPTYNIPDGAVYVAELYFNINEGAIVIYKTLTNDKELPVLLSLVKKGFLLKDESGAKLFEAALNELYPVKESERAGIKHIKKNNQWIFLRAKFFDDQIAVIVTTAPAGTITNMELKLAYKDI